MNKKDWTKRWKEVSNWWGKIDPPWTPSLGEFRIYKSFFNQIVDFKNKNRKMLILGATALLRELGDKYGYQITLIDINPEMVKEQSKLLDHKIKGERFIKGDWRKMDKIFKEEKFDLIVGDHAIINVPFKDWDKVYQNIQKLLKPNGRIFWAATVYNQKKYIHVKDIIENYRPSKSDIDKFFRIYKLFGNPKFHDKNYGFHFGRADRAIEQLGEKKGLISKQINEIKLNLGDWTSVMLPQKKFEEFTKKYFKIVDRKCDKSHLFFKYQQLYFLKHKCK